MSHTCPRGPLHKQKVNNRHQNTAHTHGCVLNPSSADGACLNPCSKLGGQHKMKQLKTRRERSQTREAQVRKHHQHHHHGRKLHYCCHNNCHCPPKRDAVLPKMHSEPSIITDSRLIGHHGLFNHEVKSVDIERFLSEQRKLEKHEQQAKEKGTAATSHSSPVSHNPSSKAHSVCQKEDETKVQSNSQGSDITPAQRPHVQPALSSDSEKATSVLDVANSQKVTSETGKHRKLQRTPSDVQILNKKVKGPQKTPKNQDPPEHQIQAGVPSPGSPPPSNPPAIPQAADPHLDLISKSLVAAAARLCRGLQLPHLRRRNLAEESREVLLQALQERHGARLQENLFKVQQCLSDDTCPTETVHPEEEESLTADPDGLWPSDAFSLPFKSDRWRFGAQRSDSFITRSENLLRFDWMPSPCSHRSLEQTAEWLRSPGVERVSSLSDDTTRPDSSPQFRVDFEAPGTPCRDLLFAPPASRRWEVQTSAPQGWDQRFSRTERRESSVSFDGLEESFLNQATVVRERMDLPPFVDLGARPFLPHPAGLIHRHAVVPQETHRLNYTQDSHHPHHHPYIHFTRSPTWPSIRSHHTNTTPFTPSHMLDRYPASPLPSHLSPEHWSFPPMRLY
ncbi:proline-rich protein 19 [Genypterus blacodes]|uniref:proline-rich protein 19 n=1 Tax=Genypterus blacodes TaxID=154954 RepID=UPI003F76E94F